jgi:diaminopropionate ammonia-lyase
MLPYKNKTLSYPWISAQLFLCSLGIGYHAMEMGAPPNSITFTNPAALTYTSNPSPALTSHTIFNFHKSLPTYTGPSPLTSLPTLAKTLNLQNLYLKDESLRFADLPSFKPLGLAWAIRAGIIAELSEESPVSISEDISLADLAAKAKEANIKLIAGSDGKLGKTVARLGKLFGVEGVFTRIFVPTSAPEGVGEGLRKEGVEVIPVEGGLEEAMREAVLHSVAVDGVFVDLEEVEGYEDIPGVSLHPP